MENNLQKNSKGRFFKPGVGDDTLWAKIYDVRREHPDFKQAEIAMHVGCSQSTISKVINSTHNKPLHQKEYVHKRTQHTFDSNLQAIAQAFLDEDTPVRKLPGLFTEMGETFDSSTIYKHVGKSLNMTRKKGVVEDPRKWSLENSQYYMDFLFWQHGLTEQQRYSVKTFDECRCDVTDLGEIEVYAVRGERKTVPQWKNGREKGHSQSFTVTVLTLLDDEFPLIYRIVEGSSNSERYVEFVGEDIIPNIIEDDIVIGDNLNYHFKGWSGDLANTMIRAIPASYIRLPTYSPELNPSEKVFSFLKRDLRNSYSVYDDLLQAIINSLNKITYRHMLGWYKKCGWL